MTASSPSSDIFDEFEFVEREPNAKIWGSLSVHDDDTDSLGVISLDESNSEGCETPSAAASAVIAALEDIGPFDRMQEIIQQAVASVHSASAATAQDDTAAPTQDPAELDGTINTSALQDNAAANDAGIADKMLEQVNPTPDFVTSSTTVTEAAGVHSCTATSAVLLLVLGACAAAVTAVLLGSMGLVPRPSTHYPPQLATVAIPHVIIAAVTFYNVTTPVPAHYHDGGFVSTGRTPALSVPEPLRRARPAGATARKPGVLSAQTAAAVPVNVLLACPKAWTCRYSKPKLADPVAGARSASCQAEQQSLALDKKQHATPTATAAAALLHELLAPSSLAAPPPSAATAPNHSFPAHAANPTMCIGAAARQPPVLVQPRSAAAAARAAVNLMLSCPKEWMCALSNNTQATTGALAGRRTTQTTANSNLPTTASKCWAPARLIETITGGNSCWVEAALNSTTLLQYQSMSLLQRLCSYYLRTPHSQKQQQQQQQAAASISRAFKQQLVRQLWQLPIQLMLAPAGDSSEQVPRPSGSKTTLGTLMSDVACCSAANTDTQQELLHTVTRRSSVNRPSRSPQDSMPSSCATAAAVVLQTAQAAKTVPPVYRPAPPCLVGVSPTGSQHSRAAASTLRFKACSTAAATAAAGNLTTQMQSSKDTKSPTSMLSAILHKAALFGSNLGLPMLPPLVYPLFAAANSTGGGGGGKTCSTCNVVQEPPPAAATGGLTLPMLPPITGHHTVSGGLTLPMLPPVSCASCDKQLQLLHPRNSKLNVMLPSPAVPPTCPVVSSTACTAPQQQYRQYRLQFSQYRAEQQQQQQQGGTSSSVGSSGGLLLVLPPVAATDAARHAAYTASSTQGGTVERGTVYALSPQPGLHQNLCTVKLTAAGAARNSSSSSSRSSSSSSIRSNKTVSVGVLASGDWVTTWVSLPMLLPSNDAPADSKQQPVALTRVHSQPPATTQHDIARNAAIAVGRPGLAAAASDRKRAAPAATAAATTSSAIPLLGSTATGGLAVKPAVLAGNPARPPVVVGSHPMPFRDWLQSINKQAGAALMLAHEVLQLISTAQARRSQCTTPNAATNEIPQQYYAFGRKTVAGEGSERRAAGNAADQANNAAHAAAKALFHSLIQVEYAAWCATAEAFRAPEARCPVIADVATAEGAAKVQEALQSLCADVATAHCNLQSKLAAAVMQYDNPTRFHDSIAAGQFTTPASVAAAVSMKVQRQGSATVGAAPKFLNGAIPLGPVGGLELLGGRTIEAWGLAGPILPLRQQLKAASRRPVPAGNIDMLAAQPKHAPASFAADFAAGAVGASVLNPGWDETSAWVVAKASARLGKAEARLQKACSSIK